MRRTFSATVAAVALIAVTSACGVTRDDPADPLVFLVWQPPGAFAQQLIDRYGTLPGLTVVPKVTAGSVSVAESLERGDGDIGFAQADVVYTAYQRGLDGNPTPHLNLRGIAALWMNRVFLVVPAGSRIRSVTEFAGARIGMSEAGTSGELFARDVLNAYGIRFDDIKPRFHPEPELVPLVQHGQLDAAIVVASELPGARPPEEGAAIRLLPVAPEVTARLRAKYPFITPLNIETGTVAGQLEPVPTIGVEALLVCRRELDEDLVYRLTKGFFAELRNGSHVDSGAATINPDTAAATPIPLHRGAALYYREREILE